jgi:hypothetical protein
MFSSFLAELSPPRMSQILMRLSTEPTAMYLELGEKAQVLREEGFSLTFGLKLCSISFI